MRPYQNKWCYNRTGDGHDFFCIYNNVEWGLGSNTTEINSRTDYYSINLNLYSNQSIYWWTEWQIGRLQN